MSAAHNDSDAYDRCKEDREHGRLHVTFKYTGQQSQDRSMLARQTLAAEWLDNARHLDKL